MRHVVVIAAINELQDVGRDLSVSGSGCRGGKGRA